MTVEPRDDQQKSSNVPASSPVPADAGINRSNVAIKVLAAGGVFIGGIGTVLTAAAFGAVANAAVLAALAAVCFIAATTLVAVAWIVRR
ncbi:hypothetical protein [Actinoplanes aureus]|uniref:Uncharacterized protein n=1 Tax=Actinoplanes aureus TaxID=2792083 RepID=A0A931G2I3_9ACTN|nr:hypothetical protein [Actinoplanes aureus]MBG0564891.1 hypothetical protein [Actinoplanes aureus]MBG0569098.1 hypothetical protein [Actinoplanes aureus]